MRLDDGSESLTCAPCRSAFFARGALAQTLCARSDLREEPTASGPTEVACPACESVLMERVRFAPSSELSVARCPYCEGIFARLDDLPAMRAVPERPPRAATPLETTRPDEPTLRETDADPTALSLRQSVIALPAAIALAAALRGSGLARVVLGGARIPLHELGHASAAWLCGYNAVPVPFGVTWISSHRSIAMMALVAAGLVLGAWRLLLARRGAWAALFGGLLVAQFICVAALTDSTRQLAITLAGSGGELVYAALLIALFHARLPERLRWDQARWIALAVGAFILVDKTLDWRAARYDDDLVPWSSVMGSDGDMQRLERDHGWTPWTISTRYTLIAYACCTSAAVAWAVTIGRSLHERSIVRTKTS